MASTEFEVGGLDVEITVYDRDKYSYCDIEIYLDAYIDRYDYHDAPLSITIRPTKQELKDLIDALTKAYNALP